MNISEIEEIIGYHFKDKVLIKDAFIHVSRLNEDKNLSTSNERLEFVGDGVLSLMISEYLFLHYPDFHEGEMSFIKSVLVSGQSLLVYVDKLGLAKFLMVGRGGFMSDGHKGDLFEAILGSIYMDGGMAPVKKFFFKNFQEYIDSVISLPPRNWKGDLQIYTQKIFKMAPTYEIIREFSTNGCNLFEVAISINNLEYGRGIAQSRKEAEQMAAKQAMEQFD